MPYQSFEDLDAWKRACRLATRVYELLADCRDFGLKDQMTRSAVSIASNIAEGYERGTNKEFGRFVNIAKGSAAELRTQAYIANQIGLLNDEQRVELVEETKGVAGMLQKLVNVRNNRVSEDDELPGANHLNQMSGDGD